MRDVKTVHAPSFFCAALPRRTDAAKLMAEHSRSHTSMFRQALRSNPQIFKLETKKQKEIENYFIILPQTRQYCVEAKRILTLKFEQSTSNR